MDFLRPHLPFGSRWPVALRLAGFREKAEGRPPPLARAVTWTYRAAAFTAALAGILTALPIGRASDESTGVFLALAGPWAVVAAAYAWVLSVGVARLRSASARKTSSALVCAPLLAHAVALLAGAAALAVQVAAGPLRAESLILGLFGAAYVALLLGWAAAFVPFLLCRRGGLLLAASFAGPLCPVLLDLLTR